MFTPNRCKPRLTPPGISYALMNAIKRRFKISFSPFFYPKTAEINKLSDLAKTYFAQINMF
jgi:hypothetical protein